MAHNLNYSEKLGRHSFFSVREKPWHGLGTIVKDALTSEQAIIEAGLDFTVAKAQLTATINGEVKNVPDKFCTYRTDNGDIFGTCSKMYEVVQNREAFEFFDALVGEGEAIFETAGCLNKGERIFITAKLPGFIKLADDDMLEKYLFLTSSHDCSGAIQCAFSPVRIVCNNTLNAALRNCSNKVSVLHFANAKDKLRKAHEIMGMSNRVSDLLQDSFMRMAEKKIVSDDLRAIIIKSLAPSKEVLTQAMTDFAECSKRFQNVVEDCMEYAEKSPTQMMASTAGTVFGAYNAITGYYQNVNEYKDQEGAMSSIIFGTGAARSQKAFDVCNEYLNN